MSTPGQQQSGPPVAGVPTVRGEAEGQDGHRAGRPRAEPDRALVIIGMVLCCVAALLAALIEVLLVPLYVGRVLLPVTIVLALATNAALPLLARRLTGNTLAAAIPVALWVICVLLLGTSRPEGDVLLPGGGNVQLVSYGLIVAGALSGIATVALAGRRESAQPSPSGSGTPEVR
jgi:Family of unknown function (DUF6113)